VISSDLIQNFIKLSPEFEESPLRKWKQYYISSSELKLSLFDAALLCNNFDLQLLSPVNDDELGLISNQLSTLRNFEFREVLIGTYGEHDLSLTINHGREINKTSVKFLELNGEDESCLTFVKDGSKLKNNSSKISIKSVSCGQRFQFMCEENFKKRSERSIEGSEVFMKPLVEFQFNKSEESTSKRLYISHDHQKTYWIKAEEICGAFGMDLFVPETSFELKMVQKELQASPNLRESFHIGAMKINRDYVPVKDQDWYSIATNKYLKFLHLRDDQSDNQSDKPKSCLMLEKRNELFVPVKVGCTNEIANFVCQQSLTKSKPPLRFVPESDSSAEDYATGYKFRWISDESK
jgi:hypothetical protein